MRERKLSILHFLVFEYFCKQFKYLLVEGPAIINKHNLIKKWKDFSKRETIKKSFKFKYEETKIEINYFYSASWRYMHFNF